MKRRLRCGGEVILTCVSFGILAASVLASAQSKTDYGIYLEPRLPELPRAGGDLVDPAFGSTILRLTDASDGSDCQVQYSYWPTFSRNNDYVLAQCSVGGITTLAIWRFDPVSFSRGAPVARVRTSSGWPISPSDAIWSGLDSEVVFGHPVNAQTINATHVRSGVNETLKDMSGGLPPGAKLRQMSKSIDDNVFAFSVDVSGRLYGYVVWRRDTDTVMLQQEAGVDEVQVDKTGRYLTVVFNDGTDRVWDLRASSAIELQSTAADHGFFHHDSGRGCLVTADWPNGLAFRWLSKPKDVTHLLSFPTAGQDMHYSMLADDEGWATISRFSTSGAPVAAPFDNEIFQVATDGSGRVRRLAHHRSVYRAYADSPRANVSRDGAFIAFSSNWGNPNGRRDVFILRVPKSAGEGALSIPAMSGDRLSRPRR
jgi:hypothetical protein